MLRACLLSAAVCMDVFFAAMGCSMNGIHIPKRCSLLISIVGTVFLAASLMGAELLNHLLPEGVLRYGGTDENILPHTPPHPPESNGTGDRHLF